MAVYSDKDIGRTDIDLSKYDKVLTIKVRGKEVPLWRFMENFLWINDKDRGEMVRFHLNFAQKMMYRQMCEQKMRGKPMRQTILKARQLGMSTFIAGVFFCNAMYRPNSRWCVLADTIDHAANIYSMYETFYDFLNHNLSPEEENLVNTYPELHKGERHPMDMRPELERNVTGRLMRTKAGRSSIEVVVAGDSAGRSASYWGVHNSESAFQKDLAKTNAAITSSVSIINPNTMVFYETTANGFNVFKEKWDRDAGGYGSGQSVYEPTFLPWYVNPSYKLKVPSTGLPKMEEWIYDRLRRHPNVTDEQAYWYWVNYTGSMNEDLMLQEFPWEPSDAFISTGHSIFSQELLQKRKDEVIALNPEYGTFVHSETYSEDGTRITLGKWKWETRPSGQWKIYKHPVRGRPYCCICDPTKGFNTDYGAIQVLDNVTGEQVAVYHSKEDDLDETGFQLICAGKYYNNAIISSENNVGSAILDIATKTGYPRIYFEQATIYEDAGQTMRRMMGHCTTRGNRNEMIEDFRLAFNRNPSIVNDYETLVEMEKFQRVMQSTGKVKIMAAGTDAHDDLVMAYVPFWRVRVQQSMRAENTEQPTTENASFDLLNQQVSAANRKAREKEREKQAVSCFGIRW